MRATENIITVIPARLASTRLPRKALLPIAGKAMIERVYEGARGCTRVRQTLVATDSQEIAAFCQSHRIPVRMTSPEHHSGTDRVCEVVDALQADAAVNVQGDEPLVEASMLDSMIDLLFSRPAIEVATLSTRISRDEAQVASNTKVVVDAQQNALYFSRAAIPYPRDDSAAVYRKHLGYYAYSRSALERFRRLAPSPLELIERLEQLRFLENGIPIAVAEVAQDTFGVDTPDDLARVEEYFRSRQR